MSTRRFKTLVWFVVCDLGAASEMAFSIPVPYLRNLVLPHAYCDKGGRLLFEVHKKDSKFNWHHGFKMNGKQFRLID